MITIPIKQPGFNGKYPGVFFVAQMITSKLPIFFLCLLWLQWVSSMMFHVFFQLRTEQKGQNTKDIGPKKENPMFWGPNSCMECSSNTCHVREGWYHLNFLVGTTDFLENTYQLCEDSLGGTLGCMLSLKSWKSTGYTIRGGFGGLR